MPYQLSIQCLAALCPLVIVRERNRTILGMVLGIILVVHSPLASAAEMLVPMAHTAAPGAGTVERYDPQTGRHLGTFLRGIDHPNAIAAGPDGDWYVATGRVGGPGAVLRFDRLTGRPKGTFAGPAATEPGAINRASSLAWHAGDLYVVSCDDSRVHRFDGRSGAFVATVARGNPSGWITQIAVLDGAILSTEFSEARVGRFPLDGGEAGTLLERPGFTPWGIAVDPTGAGWWSGSGGIARFDGRGEKTLIPAEVVPTPVALALAPDGVLACSSLGRDEVTLWDVGGESPRLRHAITERVQNPGGMAFLEGSIPGPIQFGNWTPMPSNTGRDWTPTGQAVVNLGASPFGAAVACFGIDTEGGDRAKTNLLREPMRLRFTLVGGTVVDSSLVDGGTAFSAGHADFTFAVAESIEARWSIRLDGETLAIEIGLSGEDTARVDKAELLFPFDPRAMGTTVLADSWGAEGRVRTPLVINALDMGQVRLAPQDDEAPLECRFTGSRLRKEVDLAVDLSIGRAAGRVSRRLNLQPVRLERPQSASVDDTGWARVRRGLVGLLQLTPFVPANEAGSQWLGSPGGITGNNVISDPVSVAMDRNFQWLGGMGRTATLGGVDLHRIARRTIEFWLNERMNDDGSLDYVLQKGNISADSNTGVLNAAIDHFLATDDADFVRRNRERMVRAAEYLVARDVDDDGLVETFRDGNGGSQFGDTGYDTVSSGWKNALVNGQAYKSFLGLAHMLDAIGDRDGAARFRQRAVRLRRQYNRTFFQPESNRYLWWIGRDGRRHDYSNCLVQADAVLYGIADCIERDTGLPRGPRDVMESLWQALDRAGYHDTAKGVDVDFIDAASGDWSGFRWGVPNNLEDVPDEYNFAGYGAHEFPYYCNGGIMPSDAVATIMALARAGMADRAAIVAGPIMRRQHEGLFENGSGFAMGVVNLPGQCYSILKWDGTPTDYEGIISRDCAFLQTVVMPDDPARPLFDAAIAIEQ
jgi:hypothetical protein